MAFCIGAGVFIHSLSSDLICFFSHPRCCGKMRFSEFKGIRRVKAIMYLKSGSWPEISDIEFILHLGCHAMVSTAGQSRAHNVRKDREVLSKRAMEMKYS